MEHLEKSHVQRRIQYDLFMHFYSENFDVIIENSNDRFTIEKFSI